MEILKDRFVIVEYSVQLDDGSYVKGENRPASLNFIAGYSQVLPALEERLLGLEEGREVQFVIPAREAFGDRDPKQVKWRSYEEFPQGRNLQEGKWVIATNDRTGAQYSCFVVEKDDRGVRLDYNHPLAGKDLHYRVRVVKVRPAEASELEQLRPCEHGTGGSMPPSSQPPLH